MNGLQSRDGSSITESSSSSSSSPSLGDDIFSIPLKQDNNNDNEDNDNNDNDDDDGIADIPSSSSLLAPPTQVPTTNVPLVSRSKLSSILPQLPQPVEGYEEKIAALNAGAAVPPEPVMMDGRKRYPETEVHTHTHTHIYIYIYIYICTNNIDCLFVILTLI